MWRQESRFESWRCLKHDARSQGVKRLFCVPEWPQRVSCICCPDDSRYRARFEPCGVKGAVLHALISASNAAHAKSISPHRKTRARRLDRRLLTAWGSGRSRERVSHHGIVLSLVRRAGASQIQGPNILSSELGPNILQLKARHPGGNPGANLKSISHRCHPILVAFVWALTHETIHFPLGCIQGGEHSITLQTFAHPLHRLACVQASPLNHHDDIVDSDQSVVNKELSLCVQASGASFCPQCGTPAASMQGGSMQGGAMQFGSMQVPPSPFFKNV